MARAASSYAALRPLLDGVSAAALEQRAQARPDQPGDPATPGCPDKATGQLRGDRDTPGAMLWLALCVAPAEGASVAELMSSSRMNRTTLYRHLIDHVRAGRAIQVSRGHWRAATTEDTDAAR